MDLAAAVAVVAVLVVAAAARVVPEGSGAAFAVQHYPSEYQAGTAAARFLETFDPITI